MFHKIDNIVSWMCRIIVCFICKTLQNKIENYFLKDRISPSPQNIWVEFVYDNFCS